MRKLIKKKAQAMVEYTLIVALTSLAFISTAPMMEEALRTFFQTVGNLWGQKGP